MRKYWPVLIVVVPVLVWAGSTTLSVKQPFEELRETVTFASVLTAGDNLATCTVIARTLGNDNVDNTVVTWDNTMLSGQTTTLIRKGGDDGKTYKITVRCTSDNGIKVEQDLIFKVQEY